MKLPKLENTEKYTGLYVIDFGEYSSVGFTAKEAAELVESEKYKDCKVYKIHKAYPDGKMELKGVRNEIFQLEMGMFFYAFAPENNKENFKKLIKTATQSAPPSKAKVHLAKYDKEKFVTALIYPAEYNDEMSKWLLENNYKTNGPAEGGIEAVERYYKDKPEILDKHQLFANNELENRTGQELLTNIKMAIQR